MSAATSAEWSVISSASNDARPTPISGGRANRPPKAHHRRRSVCWRAFAAVTVMAQEPAPENNPPRLAGKPAPAAATPAPALMAKPASVSLAPPISMRSSFATRIADQITEMDQRGRQSGHRRRRRIFPRHLLPKKRLCERQRGFEGPRGLTPSNCDIREGPLTMLDSIDFAASPACPSPPRRITSPAPPGNVSPNQRARCPSSRQTSIPASSVSAALYASEGFLDAVVDPPQITFKPAQTRASVARDRARRHPISLRQDQLCRRPGFLSEHRTAQRTQALHLQAVHPGPGHQHAARGGVLLQDARVLRPEGRRAERPEDGRRRQGAREFYRRRPALFIASAE